MGFEWNAENVSKLEKLWAEGYSCSEIACRISTGITRNAVIGKVHRLKLTPRVMRIPVTPTQRQAKREKKERMKKNCIRSHDIAPVIRFPKAPPKMIEPPNSAHVTLVNRTGCCWPVNDGGPFLFCNADRHGKSDYCEFHLQVRKAPKKDEEK